MIGDRERDKNQLIKALDLDDTSAEQILDGLPNDLERLRVIAPLDFLLYCESKLPPDEKILRTLFYLCIIEAFVAAKKKKKPKLVSEAFKTYLDGNEKTKLLGGFLFTPLFKFRQKRGQARHLMYEDMIKDKNFSRNGFVDITCKDCLPAYPNYPCRCTEWLNRKSNQDKYLPFLFQRLFDMRAALLHEGFGVLWFPDFPKDANVITFSATIADGHPTRRNRADFRSYESGLESKEFYGWVKKVIRGYLMEKVSK